MPTSLQAMRNFNTFLGSFSADWDVLGTFDVNQIVEGRIVEVNSDYVVVDVGFKSEGAIHRNEWGEGRRDPPQVGQTSRF
jgi:ribosomal protein S1